MDLKKIYPFYYGQSGSQNPGVFGTMSQYLDGTIYNNEFVDKSGNSLNVDIINNDIQTPNGFPYKSTALIAQKAANFGKIPNPNNFWFTSGGTPNQISVVSLFQNIDFGNQIFCKHQPQILNSNGAEISEQIVSQIVTYSSVISGANLTSANTYFSVPVIDVTAKWIDPVNGNDTTGNGSQATPYKTYGKVNGLTLTEGTLVYVKTGSTAPFAWSKNYQIKTIGFTTILSASTARGIDYDPAGTLAQELNGFDIDMANVAGSTGINCNSTAHPLTIKKFKVKRAAAAAIQSVTDSTQTFNVQDCIIDNTNLYGVYSNKALSIINSLINSSSFCIYKDSTVNSSTILISNSKIKNTGTSPFRLFYLVNLTMTGGILEWSAGAMTDNNGTTGGQRNFNGVDIKYTGTTVGSFINTESQSLTQVDIRNSKIECPNMRGAINVLDVNGTFNFINNIAYSTASTGFGISVYQKNFSNRTTVVNISNSVIRDDNTTGPIMTIGEDPHPNPNKITGIVEKMHFIHLNDETAHGFIVLYENAGITVRLNRFTGTPVNGFKSHGDSYILNIWKYCLHLNAPMLAKGVTFGNYYNNTIVVNQYMPDSATLMDIGNNAIPGPSVDSTDCKFLNNIVAYTSNAGSMIMVRIDVATNNQCDYNIYYNKNYPCTFLFGGVVKTFAQWQALGFDTHSVVLTDAQYNAMFTDPTNDDYSIKQGFVWPISGFNTGETTGLDKTTTWGSSVSVPNIVTKEQPAQWQIGAYIQ